ncbi:PREDICTED: translation factor GUF1, mitochondrial [Thamnophis sirtalis]|uniref:Translation factor GUF1, mitochondrial n=1 Tax=Thamnophis sirtalis TaxID=35019 RepID=A0A6I9Z2A5_9SAUR|nr:PREDICTED: translation factor GUF1, mitochondrial [Thamnophis sirtalis]
MPSFLRKALYLSIRGHQLSHNATFLSYLSLWTLKPSLHHAAPSRKYCSRTNKDTVDMSLFPAENIRNFSIVAHVDHGKSTLADRLLEITGAIAKTDHNKQVLDKLQVERERGITVKAQTASLIYNHEGTNYLLNLIDTPGHVDFNYEVSRSLSACQGVVLVVDANQGIQAQTVANFYLAYEAQLSIIPVINKIDLKNANPEMVEAQIENTFDILKEDCIRISAKLGTNVERILQAVIERIPPLGFLGLLHMEVFNQRLEQEHNASVILTAPTVPYKAILSSPKLIKEHRKEEITIVNPAEFPDQSMVTGYLEPIILGTIVTPKEYIGQILALCQKLSFRYAGQVGYMIAGMREIMDAQIGDTVYSHNQPVEPFPGFKSAKPMVFAGVFPTDQSEYSNLKGALEKLTLNDSSVTVQRDNSLALGAGWRAKLNWPFSVFSFDYEDAGYQPADLVKMDIFLNGKSVEELITIVPREKAYSVGKSMCEQLRDLIPRQMFEIAIQAALGNKIIARETVKAFRKDVLAKCYGGDITRKMKLLKRQAEGKKKMRRIGNVEVPKDAFIKVLKKQLDR